MGRIVLSMSNVPKKINKWSCLAASFAVVMNMAESDLYKRIGNDGSEVLDKQVEPFCRRGTHIQEIIDVAVEERFTVTTIVCFPALERKEGYVDIFTSNTATDRFARYLDKSKGVIVGAYKADIFKRHAFINLFGTVYDPDTGEKLNHLPTDYAYEYYYMVKRL